MRFSMVQPEHLVSAAAFGMLLSDTEFSRRDLTKSTLSFSWAG